MNLLEIIMLILGISAIIFSCRIVAQTDNKKSGLSLESNGANDIYLQKELNTLKDKQNEALNSLSEEAIIKTDDYLSKLSNEKIIAVSEYSDQILEKITKNHEEVVFLYNMLNNKEKELKKTVSEIDSSQQQAKALMAKKPRDKASKEETAIPKQIDTQAKSIKLSSVDRAAIKQVANNHISINNTEILKLHEQGKSVLDIAKQLGIGQGEVKLVIDLFVVR